MQTVQVVLDKKLLQATDREARRAKQNRSAFVREALRQQLRTMAIREKEEREREGYRKFPDSAEDALMWEAEAAWPED